MSKQWKFRDPKYLRQAPRNQGQSVIYGDFTPHRPTPQQAQVKMIRRKKLAKMKRDAIPKLSLNDLNKILWPSGKKVPLR